MAILSDHAPEPDEELPPKKKLPPCLHVFLCMLKARQGENITSIDPKLLIAGWPPGLDCNLDDCVRLAVQGGYATETATGGLRLTEKGLAAV